jgi:hypothetical protein
LEGRKISAEEFRSSNQKVWGEEEDDGIYHRIENRKECIHTLGNLTPLTSPLNSSVRNASYKDKKLAIIQQSTLILNAYFQNIDVWDENSIEKRSLEMYEKMKEIWAYPAETESRQNGNSQP